MRGKSQDVAGLNSAPSYPMTSYDVLCHFWQCPWEIGSVLAERVGQGEVDGCTQSMM